MNKNRQKRAFLLSAFMVFGAMGAYAQSPGGISTAPAVWYKPDSVSATKWKDASINGLDLTTQDTTATYRVSVNNGNQTHNFHKWTNGYTNTKYFSNRAATSSLFGTWGDNGVTTTASADYSGGYYYMPLTVFGVARDTLASNGTGAITGIDNDQGYGAEPGFGIYNGKQSFYRYGNGADIRNNAAAIVAPVNASAVYTWRPPAGGSTANGNDTLLMGTNGAYSKISISRRSSVAGPHINIGTDNFAYPNGFDGSIQEVIWYKDSLSISDIQKVETYLALKYGSTLAHNYVNAAGNTIYNVSGADSNYRYNIAGIGRESANGGLNQKQSNSVNPGNQLLVSTTGLASTNSSNAIALANGQFLVWGDNGLDKLPIVPVTNISGTNYRFASVWKAHNTGAVGTVRVAWPQNAAYIAIKLVQSSDATFATGNTISDMTNNTITINGVVYNYVDVAIADGQYFTIAVKAQTPGGVGMPAVWLKANAGTDIATDPGHVSSMANYGYAGGNAEQIVSGATTYDAPYYNENLHNFNPSLVDSTTNANGGLELKDVFPTYEQRALSTFVLQDQPNVGVQSTMVSFVNQDNFTASYDLPWFASQSATQLYFWWDGTGSAAPTITNGLKRYNNIPTINSYHRALWASNPDTTFLGMNGVGKMYAVGNSAASLGIGQHLLVNADGGNNNPSGGNISEVIVYDRDLTATERLQVNSYMAIKYGITLLNEDGTNTTDYLSSTATVVWDTTVNDGYNNNIAGIANDANSGIDQKQSKSVNAGQQVIVGTTGLDNSNTANSVSLTDGQYLIWGDNGEARTPSESVSGIAGINARFASVWKVENTSSVGTVRVAWVKGLSNLTLIQSSDTIFDGTDASTLMTGNEITVNNVVYNYADVTLSNGNYFTFGVLMPTPGGVVAAAWYRADAMTTVFSDTGSTVATDGASLAQWNEYGGRSSFNLRQTTASQQPVYSDSAILDNFNPTITFPGGGGNNAFLQQYSDDTVIDRANGTLFASGYFNTVHGQAIFGFDETGDYPGLHTGTGSGADNILMFSAGSSYNSLSSNAYVAGDYVIAGANWENGAGATASYASTRISFNGVDTFMNGNTMLNVNLTTANTQQIRLGGDNNWGTVDGQVNEAIVFENALDSTEMLQVSSYLAIKYGKTLANGTVAYLNSHGNVVWDPTVNAGYQNNIAGIALDNNGGLDQRQSWSMNAGTQVLISTTGLANTNNANAVNLSDGQYLVWGDNGESKSPSAYNPTLGHGVNLLFASIWKVQNTGTVATVRVAWPQQYDKLALVQSSDATFDNTDTYTDMTANTMTINGVDYNYADVELSDGQYFTFATKLAHAPGGVFNNLTLWYRADKAADNTGVGTDVTQWSDYAFNVPVASVDADALPTYASGSADSLNFNPGILFTTAQKLANISGSYALSSLNYDIFTTARQGMNGTRLFSIGADNSTTHGGSNWDQPAIYDNGSFLRRNNAFGGIISNGNGGYANSTVQPNIGYYTVTDTTYGRALNGSKLSAMTANGGNAHAGLSQGGHIFGRNAGTATNGDDAGVNGMLGETIVYGAGSLTAAERNKVNSYLAIKYGVTMDTASSYITSDSTVIWNRVSDKYFYHNVAGIGTDTISALYQKQSRSQITNNTNNQVTIAVDSIYATNVANPGIIGNMDFMVWGDNGNTQAMSNTASTYTTFTFNGSSDNRHMTRIWKVRNTNVTSQVAISFPTASVGTTTLPNEGTNTAYVLIYASDSNFSNITAISYLSEKAGQYVSAHKFSNGVSYFTYAKVTDSASALPVTLLDFNAEKVKHEVQLSWMTTNEANSKGFEVERSANAADWKAIGFVLSNADNGNSNLKLSYLFNDVQPTNGKNFYRLKEVDINGNYSYSEVRMVNFADGSSIQIHPNPVQDNVMVSGLTGNRQIVVTNVLGQVVLRAQTNGEATKELHTAVLTPGTYFITITDEQNEKVNFKMIKE